MGRVTYDKTTSTEFEDRALAHLQVVVMAKLRRGESFPFTWRDDVSTGGGRTIIWVDPHISIVFKFYGGRAPSLNRAWIDVLSQAANSPSGLYLTREPAPYSAAQASAVVQELLAWG